MINNEIWKVRRHSAALNMRAHKLMRRRLIRMHFRERNVRLSGVTGRYIATCRVRGKKRRILFVTDIVLGIFMEVCYNA